MKECVLILKEITTQRLPTFKLLASTKHLL